MALLFLLHNIRGVVAARRVEKPAGQTFVGGGRDRRRQAVPHGGLNGDRSLPRGTATKPLFWFAASRIFGALPLCLWKGTGRAGGCMGVAL